MKGNMRNIVTGEKMGGSVESYWYALNGTLVKATDRNCGWPKVPARHRETCSEMILIVKLVRSLN